MTAEQWAGENECSPTHLHYVLKEERESERLVKAIDEFIDKHLGAAA